MSITAARSGDDDNNAAERPLSTAFRLEVVTIPVADPDRSKRFYASLGWRLDADITLGAGFRVVQFTPPGSGCSIHFGHGLTSAAPGSVQRLYLVVSDIQAARAELAKAGIEVSGIFHMSGEAEVLAGPEPSRRTYGSYASFSDPDGNGWLLQEITSRLPGRIDGVDSVLGSSRQLAAALQRAEAAHGEHEKRTGRRDANWPEWYAEFMIAEQLGKDLPA